MSILPGWLVRRQRELAKKALVTQDILNLEDHEAETKESLVTQDITSGHEHLGKNHVYLLYLLFAHLYTLYVYKYIAIFNVIFFLLYNRFKCTIIPYMHSKTLLFYFV
jgi:hypothetical protein